MIYLIVCVRYAWPLSLDSVYSITAYIKLMGCAYLLCNSSDCVCAVTVSCRLAYCVFDHSMHPL